MGQPCYVGDTYCDIVGYVGHIAVTGGCTVHNGDAWLDKNVNGHERLHGKINWLGEREGCLGVFNVDMQVRQLHHILMWGFILFALVHVYLVFYHDYIERRGVTSSMIGGWKFIEEDVIERHENRSEDCPKD